MNFLAPLIENYCQKHSSLAPNECLAVEAHTKQNDPGFHMLTGGWELSLLGLLIRAIGAKRVLEFGTYTGFSAMGLATHLPDDGEVVTLDIEKERHQTARSFWDQSTHGKKITAISGPALETLKNLKGPFDFVFIDADKENYLNYFEWSLEHLSPRGVIAMDNMLWSGRVADASQNDPATKSLRQTAQAITQIPELHYTLLPIRDGVMLVTKK